MNALLEYVQNHWLHIICYIIFYVLWGVVVYYTLKHWKSSEKKAKIDKVLILVFLVDLAILFPIVCERDGMYSIGSSIIYVLRLFTLEMDYTDFCKDIATITTAGLYKFVATVLYVVSPVIAGAYILSFIKDVLKGFLLSISVSKKIYIFTELNDRALSIAKTIDKKNNGIYFLHSDSEKDTQLKEKCRVNGFVLIDHSVERLYGRINRRIFKKAEEISVFFVDSNEHLALDKMIMFIESIKENKEKIKTSIFLLSASDEAELIVDNYKAEIIKEMAKKEKANNKKPENENHGSQDSKAEIPENEIPENEISVNEISVNEISESESSEGEIPENENPGNEKIDNENSENENTEKSPQESNDIPKFENITLRLIDSAQIISYQIVENIPLYQIDEDCLGDEFNITVIGTGRIGNHIAKDMIWCGQVQSKKLLVNIVEDNKAGESAGKAQRAFEYKFPELTKENYNINHYCAGVTTKDFDDLLKNELSGSNYFVVALDNDETNILVSHNIRMKYYRMHAKFPTVVAVVTDDDKYSAVKDVFAKLRINVVGMNAQIYSMDSIINSPIYYKAYEADCVYQRKKGYPARKLEEYLNLKEFIIRSNIATAIHMNYKLWDITGIDPEKAKENPGEMEERIEAVTDAERLELDKLEHRRWNAFQRSEGQVCPFTKAELENDETFKAAIKKYSSLVLKSIESGIDYEQNRNSPQLRKSVFSKQHGCIIDYDKLSLLAQALGKSSDEFTKNDKSLNEDLLKNWRKYILEENNDNV